MALVLEANYSKKLGLPGYSSHQYSITVRKELSDVHQVDAKSRQLYELLQSCVDREIQSTGFLPDRDELKVEPASPQQPVPPSPLPLPTPRARRITRPSATLAGGRR